MVYKYAGYFISQDDLEQAIRLARLFENGNLERIDHETDIVAMEILQNKQSAAVQTLAQMRNWKRAQARKYLMEHGEEICKDYLTRKERTVNLTANG